MKAIVLSGFGNVSNFGLDEIPVPVIKSNEVLVRIKACAFNPIDFQMRQGMRERELMVSPVLGIEMAGVVVAAGSGVKSFSIGDEVVAITVGKGSNGTYAEFIAIAESELALMPKNLGYALAASFPSSGVTAWLCKRRMNALSSQSIFISGGSGAVGRFLLLLLVAEGYNNLFTSAGNAKSIAAIESLGLKRSQIINYHEPNFAQLTLDSNNGNRFDLCVDLVGGTMSEFCAGLLKINGTYLDVTCMGTSMAREVLFDKAATVENIATFAEIRSNSELACICKLIEQELLTVPDINIIGSLSVETVLKAHEMMEANQAFGKKLIMTMP